MAYIKITNEEQKQYSLDMLRKDHPNTAFPKAMSKELLAAYDVYEVITETRPSIDTITQIAELNDQATLEDDQWIYKWNIRDKTEEELQTHANIVGSRIRIRRNRLLSECDWTQVEDSPVDKATWNTYRQELRDITNQESFPYNITWPTKPE